MDQKIVKQAEALAKEILSKATHQCLECMERMPINVNACKVCHGPLRPPTPLEKKTP